MRREIVKAGGSVPGYCTPGGPGYSLRPQGGNTVTVKQFFFSAVMAAAVALVSALAPASGEAATDRARLQQCQKQLDQCQFACPDSGSGITFCDDFCINDFETCVAGGTQAKSTPIPEGSPGASGSGGQAPAEQAPVRPSVISQACAAKCQDDLDQCLFRCPDSGAGINFCPNECKGLHEQCLQKHATRADGTLPVCGPSKGLVNDDVGSSIIDGVGDVFDGVLSIFE